MTEINLTIYLWSRKKRLFRSSGELLLWEHTGAINILLGLYYISCYNTGHVIQFHLHKTVY